MQQKRRFLPAPGRAYELFDCSVFLVVLAFIGYVLTDPTPVAKEALSAPFMLLSQQTWGLFLTIAGVAGIVCSYVTSWVRAGYFIVIVACTFWAGCFLYGVVFYGPSIRAWISIVIYGWVVRRLIREGWGGNA